MRKKARLILRFLRYAFFKKRYPFTLNISIQYTCNSTCKYCNFWKYPKISMTKEQIFKIVDEADPHCFYMNLYGGEPLLRDDIGEIIDYIQKKDFVFLGITTNGILVKEKIEHLKKVDLIVLSLDGPKSYNDKVRCKGHFDHVIEAIDVLNENDIPVILNTTLCKQNLKYVDYLINLCIKKGIRISFNLYRKINDSEMAPNDLKKYKNAIKKIMKYPPEVFPYPKEVYHERYLNWPNWRDHKCTSGKDFCSITPSGDMFQCEITAEDYEKRLFAGDKVEYDNNVFKKGFVKCFEDLDLSRCVKCFTCDRSGVSYVINNKKELLKYVLFLFNKKQFLKRHLIAENKIKPKKAKKKA